MYFNLLVYLIGKKKKKNLKVRIVLLLFYYIKLSVVFTKIKKLIISEQKQNYF